MKELVIINFKQVMLFLRKKIYRIELPKKEM